MRISKLAAILIAMLLGDLLFAQHVQIKDLDESEFPLIRVNLEFPRLSGIDFNELQVFENNELTVFSIDSIYKAGQNQVICFLVDESLLLTKPSKESIVNALKTVTENLGGADLFNVLIAKNHLHTNTCIQPLSFEFTSDYQGFKIYLENYFSQYRDSAEASDLYCAIDASLDFIDLKNLPPDKKNLIVLSQPDDKKYESWMALRAKAKELSIEVKEINILTSRETETSSELNLHNILLKELDSLHLLHAQTANLNYKSYVISFYTNQNEKLNQFNIKYKNDKITGTFTRPGNFNFFENDVLLSGLVAFILLLTTFFIISLLYTKKQMALSIKKLQEKPGKENTRNSNPQIDPFDPHKTLYGNGSVTPYITVDIEGNTVKHELKKLKTTVGRHSDNDILIANLTISNHHATITNEGGIFYIQDNKSTNGTFVNEIKIVKSGIKSGDFVRLGKAKLFLTY